MRLEYIRYVIHKGYFYFLLIFKMLKPCVHAIPSQLILSPLYGPPSGLRERVNGSFFCRENMKLIFFT